MRYGNPLFFAALAAVSGCQQTPTPIPVRTFERAGDTDVVCMKVNDVSGGRSVPLIPPQPIPLAECAPVASGVDPAFVANHMYALVTQTMRGEVAVVDLSAGGVVDEDGTTPGVNFIPVGALPIDVAVSSDAELSFVASREANKPALYAIPNRRILGDTQRQMVPNPPKTARPLRLTDLPVCKLPSEPVAIAVHEQPVGADPSYVISVVLAGSTTQPSAVVTIDPRPFARGAGIVESDGGVEDDAGTPSAPGESIAPGSLAACPIIGSVALSKQMPKSWSAGPAWNDGVEYVVGGVSLSADDFPQKAKACGAPSDAPTEFSRVDLYDPEASSAVRDGNYLFVADSARPVIHLFDLSVVNEPRELAPFVATSLGEPTRRVSIGVMAVSPATHDYAKFLYAVDRTDGNIMVFDITSPADARRTPLVRPHPELNPFQPADRLAFGAPVVDVSFFRHDFPLHKKNGLPLKAAPSGLICNPNPNAGDPRDPNSMPIRDLGVYYRVNSPDLTIGTAYESAPETEFPTRLRGVFAAVMLTNGSLVIVDVDDWDAPCRRPDPMTKKAQLGSLDFPEPDPLSSNDINPYHAPNTYVQKAMGSSSAVTLEAFFPVSAPHRPRSRFLLRNDPRFGQHAPFIVSAQLYSLGASLPTGGAESVGYPRMLPPESPFDDPTYIANPMEPNYAKRDRPTDSRLANTWLPTTEAPAGVRFSREDPLVHSDQDWTVEYEGVMPVTVTAPTAVSTSDDFATLQLVNGAGRFCAQGIEGRELGQARVAAANVQLKAASLPTLSKNLSDQIGDYVQIIDPIASVDDPYWADPRWNAGGECAFDGAARPEARQQFCVSTFGPLEEIDNTVARDFPILEAYNDHLVVGAFSSNGTTTSSAATRSRTVTAPTTISRAALRSMSCCFHQQVNFRVRTGGEWLAVGSMIGFLHHVVAEPATNKCVQSCLQRDVLLNSRALEVPRPAAGSNPTVPNRDSILALRNPLFSFVMWRGADPAADQVTTTSRGLVWRFSTRGQFVPLSVSLGGGTGSVLPQSMHPIEPFGQIAIVDGSAQGLMFFDIANVQISARRYF